MTDVEAINQALRRLATQRESLKMERQTIIDALPTKALKAEVLKLSVVSLHVLSALTKKELTGIELAEILAVTRGGITQAAKILLRVGMIVSYQSQNDRKKIFYQLTEKGRQIAKVHDEMHEKMDQKLKVALFDQYDAQQKALILQFLTDFIRVKNDL